MRYFSLNSYPAIVQAENGDLLMTYSWRRRTIEFVCIVLSDVLVVSSTR
jgi:hypothetical protein